MDSTIASLVLARRLARTGEGRRLREEVGLGAREVADEVGIDVATLYRWEPGQTRPGAGAATRWVEVLRDAAAAVEMDIT